MSDATPEARPEPTLADLLAERQLDVSPEVQKKLDRYRTLLWEWNEKINLTRHDTLEKFVSRDIVDSWNLASCLAPDERILDVGTGGGVPGVIIALLRPDVQVTLLEQTEKKVQALADILKRMRLPMTVIRDRLQDHLAEQTDRAYDTLVARAVAPIPKFLPWILKEWSKFRRVILVKGPQWKTECDEARALRMTARVAIHKLMSYPLPGTDSESFLIEIHPAMRREDSTDETSE